MKPDPLEWVETAACRSGLVRDEDTVRADVARMFGHNKRTGAAAARHASLQAARKLCRECPHAGLDGPCVALWRTLDNDLQRSFGVWGGWTGLELLAVRDSGEQIPDVAARTRFRSTRDRVWHAIDEGANTVHMLTETLGLTPRQVRSALDGLSQTGRIRARVRGVGRGNPTVWEVVR